MSHRSKFWNRRSFLTLMGTGVGAGLLTACSEGGISTGGSGGTTGDYAQPAGEGAPARYANRQRIVVWSTFGESHGNVFDGLAQQFNESQEEIYVEVQFQGRYEDNQQKLTAGILAKQVPDIAVLAHNWRALYLSGAVAPLDDYYGGSLELSDYHPRFLEEGQIGGSTYWVPFARSTPLFYYNRDMLAEAGLPDRAPESWSELREWAPTFRESTVKDAKLYGLITGNDWYFRGMLWNFGGQMSDGLVPTMDSAEAIACGEYTRALMHDDEAGYLPNNGVADMTNGLVAAMSLSTAALGRLVPNVQYELGAAFMPGEVERAVPTGGGGLCVMAGIPEERQAAAVEFMKFLGQPAQAATWAVGTGYILANPAGAQEQLYIDQVAQNELFRLANEQLEYARFGDDLRMWVPEIQSDVNKALAEIWGDNVKVSDVFGPLNEELQLMANEFMDEYGDIIS